jgi:hypothetical protein
LSTAVGWQDSARPGSGSLQDMPAIRKPLGEISKDDLEAICHDEWLEDELIDFKETIPHKEGAGRDPWRDGRKIKDHGRDQLLATAVAFANSYGGDLVIGIRDGNGQPGKAEKIVPIPSCEEAADRIAQMARACIDPHSPGLKIRGIPTEADGSGVIIVRSPRSRNAPHRLTTTRECYHRVRHETVPMTMRQIQDLTFAVARGLDAVEKRLSELRASFQRWAQIGRMSAERKTYGLRVTCVPSSRECALDRVHNVDEVRPRHRVVRVEIRPGHVYEFNIPFAVHNWQPVLRGTQAEGSGTEHRARIQLFCDGVVSYESASDVPVIGDEEGRGRRQTHILFPEWLFSMVVNAFEAANRFREFAGATVVEYAVEVEIVASHDLPVVRLGRNNYYDTAGTITVGPHVFPLYVLGAKDTWEEMLKLMWRDFWNSIGVSEGGDYFRLVPH